MAFVTEETKKYIVTTDKPKNDHWTHIYGIGQKVPVSGIYRCYHCGDEITSNAGDPFPPQNKNQHQCQGKPVQWELIVRTQTKA